MSVKVALATKLKSISALTAIVGTRIYSVALPQDFTLPAVTFRRVGYNPARTLKGHSGKARTTFDVMSYATTDTEAGANSEIIRIGLDGYSGTIGGVKIRAISMTDAEDDYDPDLNLFGTRLEIIIAHEETT